VVGVSCWVRYGRLPTLHQALSAKELQLRVGAARKRRRVNLGEQVLGGNWEGGRTIVAKGEQHRMWEGVDGEVGPVLRRGLGLRHGRGSLAPGFPRERIL